MDPKISKEKKNLFIFFNVFWNLCVYSILFFNLCVFPISYKCEYVLFHLNMLKLFQEINIFFSFRLK
jgi:hypothetical protein